MLNCCVDRKKARERVACAGPTEAEDSESGRFIIFKCPRVYPEVFGLAAWSETCKWYSSLPLGAVVSLMSFAAITICFASKRGISKVTVHFVINSVRELLDAPLYNLPMFSLEWCIFVRLWNVSRERA
jgi:hypothetical protein